ncbi:MAG: PqiC family protein [Limisphaerales bacterium]
MIMSILAALAVVLNGCFSLKPASGQQQYYLLTGGSSNHSSGHGGGVCVVRVLPVEAPDYLRTRDMAVRTGDNAMIFNAFHEWAEPLDNGIRRVMVEDLRGAPGIQNVLTDEPAPANAKVYIVSIHILSCEGNTSNGQSSVLFEAHWEISESETPTPQAQGIFSPQPNPWRRDDYSDLATQISRSVEILSRVLNKALQAQVRTQEKR